MNFILQRKGRRLTQEHRSKGISDFQKIVAQGISRNCSSGRNRSDEKLRGESKTKIVVIGHTKNGCRWCWSRS